MNLFTKQKQTHGHRKQTYDGYQRGKVVVQSPSCVRLFATPWTAVSSPVPHHLPEFAQHHVHCISDAVQSSHPLTPFSFCPWSFPASGTFPTSHLFTSDDQNTGVSASALVLPVNIQGWSPLRLTDLISLLSKGPSGVFSSTTIQRHQFFGILPSLRSSSHNPTWPLGRPCCFASALTIWTFVRRLMFLL